ncbi:hypothetical protein WMY93_006025 [Mugilogobius chulae]|uniref:GRF-type domain-containing protein n=1 Tax=Mugilogobius chulae TaxID=88201 RepID=A0AAW0PIX5_9GOBI
MPKPVSKPKFRCSSPKKCQTSSSFLKNEDRCGSYDDVVLDFVTEEDVSQDAEDPRSSSRFSRSSSRSWSNTVLSDVSVNTSLSSRTRPTAPLCVCGRRAKRQTVSNGGPNQGRGFFCCPGKRSGGGDRAAKRCDFFKWESAVLKDASVSSASLCVSRDQTSLRKSF